MKSHRTNRPHSIAIAIMSGLVLLTGGTHAEPFLYRPGDLVLTLRQTGGASDLVVNIGRATNFNALPEGTAFTIESVSGDQVAAAFSSVASLAWAVVGANRPPADPAYPLQTIWVTAPRLDIETQSPAWLRKGQFVQATAASQIQAIGVNAAASSSSQPTGPLNTASSVVIAANSDFALAGLIGDAGDLVGTFQGSIENTTPVDFDSAPDNRSRADLYELVPGTTQEGTIQTPGRHLGYFELKANGALIFQVASAPAAKPEIRAISRSGDTTTITFQSVEGVTYRLRFTNSSELGASPDGWATGTSVVGTGAVLSLEDTNAEGTRFFVLEAQP
jgi:hypothetical protein